MKRILLLILPFILAACTEAAPVGNAFEQTKLFALTAGIRTIAADQPKNDTTLAAIVAAKSAGGTAMAETMTSLPTGTP